LLGSGWKEISITVLEIRERLAALEAKVGITGSEEAREIFWALVPIKNPLPTWGEGFG